MPPWGPETHAPDGRYPAATADSGVAGGGGLMRAPARVATAWRERRDPNWRVPSSCASAEVTVAPMAAVVIRARTGARVGRERMVRPSGRPSPGRGGRCHPPSPRPLGPHLGHACAALGPEE